jgi:glycosyltransferase involved in cell wall biosynthesis
MVNIVIAVITCRRPEWLNRLLEELLKQNVRSDMHVSVLIVDNASDAQTKNVVLKHQYRNSSIDVLYDVESTPGIVFARNKCVTTFLKMNGEYLLFIDDDEWPGNEFWLINMFDAAINSKKHIVTSHVISVGEEGTPAWAVDLIYGDNPLSPGQAVDVFYTNNLLLSREVITSVFPCFDERFAMTGASDYHFSLRCKKAGFSGVYIDAPVIEEFPKSRASIKWFCRRGFRSGIGYTRSHLFEERKVTAIARCLVMSIIRLLRGVAKLAIGIFSFNKMRFVDGLFRISSAAGTIAGFLGIKHEEYKIIHGK